jgi:hypothetical protein
MPNHLPRIHGIARRDVGTHQLEPLMRRAARTDAVHAEIVKALRKVGCQVLDLSRVGEGCPDLLVRRRNGEPALIEVKTPRGRLTPDQQRFIADWPETIVARSVDDALAAVGVR